MSWLARAAISGAHHAGTVLSGNSTTRMYGVMAGPKTLEKYSNSFVAVSAYAAAYCFLLGRVKTLVVPTAVSTKGPAMMVPGKLGFCQLKLAIVLVAATWRTGGTEPLPMMIVPVGAVMLMLAVKRSMP